jgi:hypothetical protein
MALADLASRLSQLTGERFSDERLLGDPDAGARLLADVQRHHGLREDVLVDPEDLRTIRDSLASGHTLTRRQLVDAAYGVMIPLGDDEPSIMEGETKKPFAELLAQASSVAVRPRRFRRVYGGMLSSYLSWRPQDPTARKRWDQLRLWLEAGLGRLDDSSDEVQLLVGHRNLLTSTPCARYVEGASDDREIAELRDGLRVPQTSWVFGEILLARVVVACKGDDLAFAGDVDRLLVQTTDFPAFEADVIAALLDRYADANYGPTEHRDLRNRSIALWGNPFDKSARAGWSRVKKSTRKVVEGWIKERVMDLFFRVIAKQSETDNRRSIFWTSFLEEISDFHLFLGSKAYYSRAAEHVELRELMKGKYSKLEGNETANNGFLMFIGDTAYLEFSVTANACYVYDARDLPVDLDDWVASISALKDQKRCLGKMRHQPPWEARFRQRMRMEFGYRGAGGKS